MPAGESWVSSSPWLSPAGDSGPPAGGPFASREHERHATGRRVIVVRDRQDAEAGSRHVAFERAGHAGRSRLLPRTCRHGPPAVSICCRHPMETPLTPAVVDAEHDVRNFLRREARMPSLLSGGTRLPVGKMSPASDAASLRFAAASVQIMFRFVKFFFA